MATLAHRITLGLAALVVATGTLAQPAPVYRYVESSGRVVYSDRPPPADAKSVQTKQLGANYIETSTPDLAAQVASDRFPATLFTFECGEVCLNAEGLLNKRGVPFATVNVQSGEQAMARLKTVSGEDKVPVLTLGDKIIVKGFNEARWQAALDEAGYPKTTPPRRAAVGARPEAPAPASAPAPTSGGTKSVAPPARGGDYPK